MEYRELGRTGLRVSRLCFGSLTIGPLQAGLPLEEGAGLIRRAITDYGVNFVDTAELYRTYRYLGKALEGIGREVIVAAKSYASTAREMEDSLHLALKEMGIERVGAFLLHEQESIHTIRGHWGALEYLVRARERGLVGAVVISTHAVAGVRSAARIPEIQVIHPIINYQGLGILDGTAEDMLAAIQEAKSFGKGIYAMKALGGGNLHQDLDRAVGFVRDIPWVDSIALGIKNPDELEMDVRLVLGEPVNDALRRRALGAKKRLRIEEWCDGCGSCLEACHEAALRVVDGRAVVDESRCLLCGYCGARCPDFAIKMF